MTTFLDLSDKEKMNKFAAEYCKGLRENKKDYFELISFINKLNEEEICNEQV